MGTLRARVQPVRRLGRRAAIAAARAGAHLRRADVAVFHEFAPPPFGGGNQFMLALVGAIERRGLRVERNTISASTRACLFNSYNFDFERLRLLRRRGCPMLHRVDGPIALYRGFDDGTDAHIIAVNAELADATVFQSQWSLDRHRELGLEFAAPRVIPNAVDPQIFHARGKALPAAGGKVRLIASSWSDNPRKGGDVYACLDEMLDRDRFDFTFVGRTRMPLPHGTTLAPVPSRQLAELLRAHDVFVAASFDDPCSNAVLEALACGLPVLYRESGGHPELVGDAGFGFREPEQLPGLLDRLVDEYTQRQAAIQTLSLEEVCDAYLDALGLGVEASA